MQNSTGYSSAVAEPGLRERKKARTRTAISEAAIALFLERGYDDVSVAEIADAAEVSKRTLFAYFPTKDALVLHRFADHADDTAVAVRERAPGESPLAALRRRRLAAIDRRDPAAGVNDHPGVVAFYRLLEATPALLAGMVAYTQASEAALTTALHDAAPEAGRTVAAVVAAQVVVTERVLGETSQRRILAGASTEDVVPTAIAETQQAYDLLEGGCAPFARPSS